MSVLSVRPVTDTCATVATAAVGAGLRSLAPRPYPMIRTDSPSVEMPAAIAWPDCSVYVGLFHYTFIPVAESTIASTRGGA